MYHETEVFNNVNLEGVDSMFIQKQVVVLGGTGANKQTKNCQWGNF